MAIYTSYFGNYRNFPKDAFVISVALRPPPNFQRILAFSPDSKILYKYKNKEINEEMYIIEYLKQLDNIPEEEISRIVRKMRDFEVLHGNVVLCCYEKTGEFCHRHILREWLNKNINDLDIKELI